MVSAILALHSILVNLICIAFIAFLWFIYYLVIILLLRLLHCLCTVTSYKSLCIFRQNSGAAVTTSFVIDCHLLAFWKALTITGIEPMTFWTRGQHVVPELCLGLVKLFDFNLVDLQLVFCLLWLLLQQREYYSSFEYCSFSCYAYYDWRSNCIVLRWCFVACILSLRRYW